MIAANRVDREIGRLTYTQLLNSRGGIECDLTVARLAEDRFYIVSGTGFRTHDLAWIREHIPPGLGVRTEDVTEAWGTLSLMGPRSRQVLAAVTSADVSNAAFPFGHLRPLSIGGTEVRALRVTYVGELGWGAATCSRARPGRGPRRADGGGEKFRIRPIGYRALESLRVGEGLSRLGYSDITPNDNPFEAGPGWAVKLREQAPFIGREALAAARDKPLPKLLTTFTTRDPDAVLLGRETILRDGQFAGYLTSGGYGYTTERPIGLGYVRRPKGVDADYLRAGHYELVVANAVQPADIHLEALYDPKNLRVKA